MIRSYGKFYEAKDVFVTPNIYDILDKTADRIPTEGYGRPLRDLLTLPEFSKTFRGRQVCDDNVLFDRIYHPLRSKNRIPKLPISWGEKMTMLLQGWKKFNEEYNPKKLKFSKWLEEPQTLYRGIPGDSPEATMNILSEKPFYSFSFLQWAAVRFTGHNYASGAWTPRSQLNGIVVKTEAKPKDFHIFVAFCSDDEMEVILPSPIEIELVGKVEKGVLLSKAEAA